MEKKKDDPLAEDTYTKPPHGWTCFHCGDTFTTPGAARDHFGFDCSAEPGCRIKVGAERGLLMALRRAEGEVKRLSIALHAESADGIRQFRRLQSQMVDLVRAAEQDGYDKALRDVEAGKVEPEHALRIVNALRAILARHGQVVLPVKMLRKAHAVMRECGWQLAPASDDGSDGVLALAAADIEERFGAALAAAQEPGHE